MEKDKEDFQLAMIERYSDMVYRLAYSLVKQKFDADDIHQEVFIRYLRKKPIFQNQENEKAWFLRVTINCCKNHWKSAWMRKITGLGPEDSGTVFELEERDLTVIEAVKSFRKNIGLWCIYFTMRICPWMTSATQLA